MAKKKQPSSTKIAVVADCHIGNHKHAGGTEVDGLNERGRMTVEAFRGALRAAKKEGAEMLVVAGDLFHVRRPEPAVIAAVQHALQDEAGGDGGLPVLIVPGNHDMLDASAKGGNTACAPLYREATVIHEPTWLAVGDGHMLAIPFEGAVTMREHMTKTLAENDPPAYEDRILVTHVGVYDNESPHWCRGARDAIHVQDLMELLEKYKFKAAFVGNYHQHRVWGGKKDRVEEPLIVQVGTLCPGGYGDAGLFPGVGGMAVYDGGLRMMEVPGPRFVTLKGREELPPQAEEGVVFLRAPVGWGGKLSGSSQRLEFYEDTPDAAKVDLPQAEDAEEAIASFAAGMDNMPDDVLRVDVIERSLKFWKDAQAHE